MKLMLSALLVLTAHFPAAAAVPSREARSASPAEEHIEDGRLAARKAAAAERAEITPLRAKEQSEISAINADKKKSSDEKRAAAAKVRKKYLAQKNAIRLRIRTELQKTLQRDPAN